MVAEAGAFFKSSSFICWLTGVTLAEVATGIPAGNFSMSSALLHTSDEILRTVIQKES